MLPRWRAAAPEPYRPPAALFGMDLAPENLPPDVGAAAAALAREGKLREALGLLYRGALSELVHKRGVQLLSSHTEGEAVRLAKLPYFAALVDAWQQCAYARRMPQAADVERLANDYRARSHEGRLIALSAVGILIVLGVAGFSPRLTASRCRSGSGRRARRALREFLAAQRFAERMGWKVTDMRSLPELDTLPARRCC